MSQTTKEKFQSGDKLIFFQVHNIVPILIFSAIIVYLTLTIFSLLGEQRDALVESNKRQEQLEVKVNQLLIEAEVSPTPTATPEPTTTPTPTKRATPTPTPEGE